MFDVNLFLNGLFETYLFRIGFIFIIYSLGDVYVIGNCINRLALHIDVTIPNDLRI